MNNFELEFLSLENYDAPEIHEMGDAAVLTQGGCTAGSTETDGTRYCVAC
jgi:hypothetical protein